MRACSHTQCEVKTRGRSHCKRARFKECLARVMPNRKALLHSKKTLIIEILIDLVFLLSTENSKFIILIVAQ